MLFNLLWCESELQKALIPLPATASGEQRPIIGVRVKHTHEQILHQLSWNWFILHFPRARWCQLNLLHHQEVFLKTAEALNSYEMMINKSSSHHLCLFFHQTLKMITFLRLSLFSHLLLDQLWSFGHLISLLWIHHCFLFPFCYRWFNTLINIAIHLMMLQKSGNKILNR